MVDRGLGFARAGIQQEGINVRLPNWRLHRWLLKCWPRMDILIALLSLGMLFTAVYTAASLVTEKVETEAVSTAVNVAERDARLLAEYWAIAYGRIVRLHTMAETVTQALSAGDQAGMEAALDHLRLALSISIPGLIQVAAVDAHGFVSWSTLDKPLTLPDSPPSELSRPPIDLSEREHIRAILEEGRDTFVGLPVVGKVSGRRTIQFAASQRDANGHLIGASVVSFDLAQAEELASEIKRHSRDRISLIRHDRVVIASSNDEGIGLKLKSSAIRIPRDGGGSTLVARRQSQIDGVRRIIVRLPIAGSDLAIAVGLDEEEALRSARTFAERLHIGAGIFCFMSALLAAAAIITWRQVRRAANERARAEIQAARDVLLHEIARWSQDLISVVDENHHYILVNEGFRIVLGLEPETLIGKTAGSMLLPNQRAQLAKSMESIEKTGNAVRVSFPFTRQDGKLVWLEFEICPITLPPVQGKERRRWLFIGRDITDRKTAEQALEVANENLQALAQSSPGSLYRVEVQPDGTARIQFGLINPKMLQGFDEAIWSQPGFLQSILHPEDRDRFNRLRADILRDGHGSAEYRLRHKDGHYIWRRDTANAVRRGDGTHMIYGYVMDITQEMAQAAELNLARKSIGLDAFATGITHEIGQPLAAISLAAENALMAAERGSASLPLIQEKLGRILGLTERTHGIVDNIMDKMLGSSRQNGQTRGE